MLSSQKVKDIFQQQINAISQVKNNLDYSNFSNVIRSITKNSNKKIFLIGVGKAGFIAKKIAASMQSVGLESYFLHPTECLHGDLGLIQKKSNVIFFSNSGNSAELLDLFSPLKKLNANTIGITGNINSALAQFCSFVICYEQLKECDEENLVPTTSTSVMMVIGDAITLSLIQGRKNNRDIFAKNHPGGALGQRLLKVKDVMTAAKKTVVVEKKEKIKKVIIDITAKKTGCAVIVNNSNEVVGFFSDGDLRRNLESHEKDILSCKIEEIMSKKPITVRENILLYKVVKTLKKKKIGDIPVIDKNKKYLGLLSLKNIIV